MPKLPRDLAGWQVIQALERLGFVVVRQVGSHVNMKKVTPAGEIPVTVPQHRSLKSGLLRAILRQAQVDVEQLLEQL